MVNNNEDEAEKKKRESKKRRESKRAVDALSETSVYTSSYAREYRNAFTSDGAGMG